MSSTLYRTKKKILLFMDSAVTVVYIIENWLRVKSVLVHIIHPFCLFSANGFLSVADLLFYKSYFIVTVDQG